jgi:hypothetical protein
LFSRKKAQTSLAFLENKKPTTTLWVSFCGERGTTSKIIYTIDKASKINKTQLQHEINIPMLNLIDSNKNQ